MTDVHEWFSLSHYGHVRLALTEEERETLPAAKALVMATYPHVVEMPIHDAPLFPSLAFDEPKQPWTSFYSRSEVTAFFAFADVKDAVEFRLKL